MSHSPGPESLGHVCAAKQTAHMLLCDTDSTLGFAIERVLVARHWFQDSVHRRSPGPERLGARELRSIVMANRSKTQARE
eukprot:1326633-Rhodomonas_salina.1